MPSEADKLAAIIVDPLDVKVGRATLESGEDRIVQTYTVEYEDDQRTIQIWSRVDEFSSFVVAILNALGFPEGDLEYIANRLIREGQNAATKPQDKLDA